MLTLSLTLPNLDKRTLTLLGRGVSKDGRATLLPTAHPPRQDPALTYIRNIAIFLTKAIIILLTLRVRVCIRKDYALNT